MAAFATVSLGREGLAAPGVRAAGLHGVTYWAAFRPNTSSGKVWCQ